MAERLLGAREPPRASAASAASAASLTTIRSVDVEELRRALLEHGFTEAAAVVEADIEAAEER